MEAVESFNTIPCGVLMIATPCLALKLHIAIGVVGNRSGLPASCKSPLSDAMVLQ